MNQTTMALTKVETEVAALLVAGLVTPRAGRAQLGPLADEIAGLKMERLAVELRKLAREQDPATLTSAAMTALTMARKLKERLASWPQIELESGLSLASNPAVRFPVEFRVSETPDVSTLANWLETGDSFLRAHAVTLLMERGDQSIPDLVRLARKGTLTIRREAITALGKLRSEASLVALVGLLGDDDCCRALTRAILPHGAAAVSLLSDASRASKSKKGADKSRRMAVALLHRLGQGQALSDYEADDDAVVRGFALVPLIDKGLRPGSKDEDLPKLTVAVATIARAEASGDTSQAIEVLDALPVNEAQTAVRSFVGGPLEPALIDHYLSCLRGGNAKTRERAARVLRWLADPAAVPKLVSLLKSGDVSSVSEVIDVLGHIGGDQAVGVLLDLSVNDHFLGSPWQLANSALAALAHLGDPGTAPRLTRLLLTSDVSTGDNLEQVRAVGAEVALAAMGDSVVDLLAREMAAGDDPKRQFAIQHVLKQMNTARARQALEAVGIDSVEALIAQLNHSKLGPGAVKALAKRGESVLERLEPVVMAGPPLARRNALEAISKIHCRRADQMIENVVKACINVTPYGHEAHLCAYAVEMLSSRQDPSLIPLFVQVASFGPQQARTASIGALVKAGNDAIPLVAPLLDHPDAAARSAAANVLGQLTAVAFEDRLIALLGDSSEVVRKDAIEALGTLGRVTGNPRVVQALGEALLRETSTWLPQHIITAFGRMEQRAAIPYLRQYLQPLSPDDPNFQVRYVYQLASRTIAGIDASAPRKGVFGKLRGILGGN